MQKERVRQSYLERSSMQRGHTPQYFYVAKHTKMGRQFLELGGGDIVKGYDIFYARIERARQTLQDVYYMVKDMSGKEKMEFYKNVSHLFTNRFRTCLNFNFVFAAVFNIERKLINLEKYERIAADPYIVQKLDAWRKKLDA